MIRMFAGTTSTVGILALLETALVSARYALEIWARYESIHGTESKQPR
jgi:hypothetical protein